MIAVSQETAQLLSISSFLDKESDAASEMCATDCEISFSFSDTPEEILRCLCIQQKTSFLSLEVMCLFHLT